MLKNSLYRLINQSITLSLGLFCIFSIVNLQSARVKKVEEATLTKETYFKNEKVEELKLAWFKKMPAFGFNNLIADWNMLEFLQYFGDSKARKQTGHSLSDDYLEVIANNDPYFVRAYMFISPASSIFGGTPKHTIQILNRVLEHLTPDISEAYFLWIYKGTDEILFFGDLKEAKKSYEKALEWATIAEDRKIAISASSTVKFLDTNPNVTQAQVGIWLQVWVNNREEKTRNMAQQNIEKLGGELKVYPDGRVEAIPPQISDS